MASKQAKRQILNRTIFTSYDNLIALRGMNSETVDLIYLDPPFNSKKSYQAPIGTERHDKGYPVEVEGGEFGDRFKLGKVDPFVQQAMKDTWILNTINIQHLDELHAADELQVHEIIIAGGLSGGEPTMAYLLFMAVRLLEMRRVLKPDGSIYLHCDQTESHGLKLLMDAIFGRQNFRNEIIWAYTGPSNPNIRQFPRKHDNILWYSKGENWTFNSDDVRVPYKDPNQSLRKAMDAGRGIGDDEVERYRARGKIVQDWWPDIALAVRSPQERVGYPTQKPLALLERIISASSNPGEVVFDPFAGCATAAVAAERLDRQWIAADWIDKAAELVKYRLRRIGLDTAADNVIHRTDVPLRTDLGRLPPLDGAMKGKLYFDKGNRLCEGCKKPFNISNLDFDHIVPKSMGGTDHIQNLQLMCGNCNSRKQDGDMTVLQERRLRDRTVPIVLNVDKRKGKR